MRSSNKSRSRNKSGNRRNQPSGNAVNRVFDSSGPEGRVRGTPTQIVEKYSSLARDAQLAGDRVAAENFSQHSEHYLRLLNEAQREQAERQAEHQKRQQQHQQNQPQKQVQNEPVEPAPVQQTPEEQPPMAAMPTENELVETPENKPAPRKARRPRTTKPVQKPEEATTVETPAAE